MINKNLFISSIYICTLISVIIKHQTYFHDKSLYFLQIRNLISSFSVFLLKTISGSLPPCNREKKSMFIIKKIGATSNEQKLINTYHVFDNTTKNTEKKTWPLRIIHDINCNIGKKNSFLINYFFYVECFAVCFSKP